MKQILITDQFDMKIC